MNTIRQVVDMAGVVQGVGFRPALYRLAREAGLGGWVQNRPEGVRLAVEGEAEVVERFLRGLPARLPQLARIEALKLVETTPLAGPPGEFTIRPSEDDGAAAVSIPTDLAVCPDCLAEALDPAARRYGYPFTTCTRCGPRYTVTTAMPYDRERTTMAAFPLCEACRREYTDPADRRFHAETVACGECGPHLFLDSFLEDCCGRHGGRPSRADSRPFALPSGGSGSVPTAPEGVAQEARESPDRGLAGAAPLAAARRALAAGRIVAVRGIGGYLLAADALNRDTVLTLRTRKDRPHKPLAVMAASLEVIRRYCVVPPAAGELLASPAAPIVILDVRPEWREEAPCRLARREPGFGPLPAEPAGSLPVTEGSHLDVHPEPVRRAGLPLDLIAPDTGTLGVMLPTSPLHALLFQPVAGDPTRPFELLIMTSGNRRGEPLCLTNDEARERLGGIADDLLGHNREIALRNDDSVCAMQGDAPQVWRRARGFAPSAVILPRRLGRCVLAMGADFKNAVAVGYDDRVVLSPHVGDLDTPEAVGGQARVVECLPAFLERTPEVVAVDLHPDMVSTRAGRHYATQHGLPVVEVQHHHAHALAALAEHGLAEGLALVFDGTGLGPDGTLWGAEMLEVRPAGYTRLGTFAGVPLPGGDAAVLRPARQAVGRWVAAGVAVPPAWAGRLHAAPEEIEGWVLQCQTRLNAPVTHSAGRLLDAFAAVLGVAAPRITYDGQPAIRLEAVARTCAETALPEVPFRAYEADGGLRIDWGDAFRRLADPEVQEGRVAAWALAVHEAVARAALAMTEYAAARSPLRAIALSGGVFMNRILTGRLAPALERMGFRVCIHRQVPPNDGGIALGQTIAAGS